MSFLDESERYYIIRQLGKRGVSCRVDVGTGGVTLGAYLNLYGNVKYDLRFISKILGEINRMEGMNGSVAFDITESQVLVEGQTDPLNPFIKL